MESSQCKYANIIVDPGNIDLSVPEGWKFIPNYQYFTVDTDGPGMFPRWDIQSDQDWVRVNPMAGRERKRVGVSASSIGMPAGVYHALLEITSHEGITVTPPAVNVMLTIVPKEVPPEPEPPPPDPDPEP